jgi:hypothetical protein
MMTCDQSGKWMVCDAKKDIMLHSERRIFISASSDNLVSELLTAGSSVDASV